jgi:hypothetical protein
MKRDAMDDLLIGYLLNALDPWEHAEVEAYLRSHPEAGARLEMLKRVLQPLATLADVPAPGPTLVLGTIARVAELRCQDLPAAPPPSPRQVAAPSRRWLRRADVLVAASLMILIGGLAAPAVASLWHDYQRHHCQNNLRTFWQALQMYGTDHDGQLPKVEKEGPSSVAGVFVPVLHDAGLLPADASVSCSGHARTGSSPPSLAQLQELWNRPNRGEYFRVTREMAGDYAYSLGYVKDGELHGPRTDDSYAPILADSWPASSSNENSPNHEGTGQNVLSVGGQVRWYAHPWVRNDNIYLNDRKEVAPGVADRDIVLAPSNVSAFPQP